MPPLVEAKNVDDWFNEGHYLDQAGKYEEAVKAYDKVLKINPQYADAWYNKGIALVNLRKYKEAINAYDEALKINPQYADAWYNKGIALAKLKKYKDAIKVNDEAMKSRLRFRFWKPLSELWLKIDNIMSPISTG
jgi:tetratricopeptide (TPR) repeat protein